MWCVCVSNEQTHIPPVEQSNMLRQTPVPRDTVTAICLLWRTQYELVCSATFLPVLSLELQLKENKVKVMCLCSDVPAVTCEVVKQQRGYSCGFKLLLTFAYFCQREFNRWQCLPIGWKMDKLYELIRKWKGQKADKWCKVHKTFWKTCQRDNMRHNPD